VGSIFIGMIFIFLNFDLNIGNARIGLIPDFIGYSFMLNGLSELEWFSRRFSKIKPVTSGMITYSILTYAFALIGGTTSVDIQYALAPHGLFLTALGLAALLISLFISYNIIMGIRDIELYQDRNLNSGRLYSTWKMMAVFSVLTFTAAIMPALAVVGLIVTLVATVMYLFAFNKAKNLFRVDVGVG